MKTALITSIFLLSTYILISQTFQWVHSVPVEYTYNPFNLRTTVSLDSNDDLIFCGTYLPHTNLAFGDIFFQRVGQDGIVIDEIIMEGQGIPPSNMVTDFDNNIYFFIHYHEDLNWGDNSIEAYTSQNNLALVKLDEDFNIVWVQYGDSPTSVYNSKPIIIQGESIYIIAIENSWVIRKMNLDGETISDLTNENIGYLSSIEVDAEGNIYATGSCADAEATFNGVQYPPPDFYNTYLVKYNSAGNPQWVNYFIDITCNNSIVKVAGSDNIYFSGILDTEITLGNISMNGPYWVYDFFLARLSSNGEYLWATEVPEVLTGDATNSGSSFVDLPNLIIDDDKNTYLTGIVRGDIDWGNGVLTESTNLYYDILLWSYDENGNIRFAESAGGEVWDVGQSLTLDENGEIYMSGVGSDTATFGDIVYEGASKFSFITRFGYGTSNIINDNRNKLHVYPNPSSDYIIMDIQEPVVVIIYDMLGKVVHQEAINSDDIKIVNTSSISSGLYLIKAFTRNALFEQKLIFQ